MKKEVQLETFLPDYLQVNQIHKEEKSLLQQEQEFTDFKHKLDSLKRGKNT